MPEGGDDRELSYKQPCTVFPLDPQDSIPCLKMYSSSLRACKTQPITASDQKRVPPHLNHVKAWRSLLECISLSTAPGEQFFDAVDLRN